MGLIDTTNAQGKRVQLYEAGDILRDQFEIVRILGKGTSGVVYEAKDLKVGTRVALKLIHASVRDQEGTSQRLHQEIRIAYNVRSDYVTNLYSCFTDEEHVGLVLEYVNGTSLHELNKDGQIFSIRETLNISRQLTLGVQTIHEAGIIHRDLKLENILLNENGIAKITDFGVSILESAILDEADVNTPVNHENPKRARRATEDGKIVGTIHYLSPEYLMTQKCDARSDIYALGIVMYELITGTFPFEYDDVKHLIKRKLMEDPIPADELRGDCPKWLSAIIAKAMHRDADLRFQSAKELYDVLAPAIQSYPLDNEAREIRRSIAIEFHQQQESATKQKRLAINLIGGFLLGILILLTMIYFSYLEMIYYQIIQLGLFSHGLW